MTQYIVEITRTTFAEIEVEADSPEEAAQEAKQAAHGLNFLDVDAYDDFAVTDPNSTTTYYDGYDLQGDNNE